MNQDLVMVMGLVYFGEPHQEFNVTLPKLGLPRPTHGAKARDGASQWVPGD